VECLLAANADPFNETPNAIKQFFMVERLTETMKLSISDLLSHPASA
jgi:hypothetical protein